MEPHGQGQGLVPRVSRPGPMTMTMSKYKSKMFRKWWFNISNLLAPYLKNRKGHSVPQMIWVKATMWRKWQNRLKHY